MSSLLSFAPLIRAHVQIYGSTERCEADAANSSGLGAGLCTENTSRNTPSTYAI